MRTFKQFLEDKKTVATMPEQIGTYAAVRPHPSQMHSLVDFMHSNGVPNPEPSDKLHVTLLYSRKHLPNYVPDRTIEHPAYPEKFEVWKTKSGKNCLVLKLECDSLEYRHEHLMDTHGATYDYPQYKVHMSLSYDIGDFDVSTLDINKLPFVNDAPYCLYLTNEYDEPLNTEGK